MADNYQPPYGRRRDDYDDRDHYHPQHCERERERERDYHDSYSRAPDRHSYEQYLPSSHQHPDDYRDQRDQGTTAQFAFRGAAGQQSYSQSNDRSRYPSEFTFRAQGGGQVPRFPPINQHRPADHAQQRGRTNDGDRGRRGGRGRGNQRGALGHRTGGFRSKPAHSRAILIEAGRSTTPEQLAGMNQAGASRFNDADSTGESDAAPMDISSDSEDDDAPRKRVKTSAQQEAVIPKWSNPDPYTVLPPPESLGAPKKDIVHVIRKAKVGNVQQHSTTNAVKDNVDFISFDFGEDDGGDGKKSRGVAEMEDGELEDDEDGVEFVSANTDTAGGTALAPLSLSSDASSDEAFPVDINEPRPPPPSDFVLPTDQELVTQYGGIGDFVDRLDSAKSRKGLKRKYEAEMKGRGAGLDASILQEWQSHNCIASPWFSGHSSDRHHGNDRYASHPHLADRNLTLDRLHDEIQAFSTFVQPQMYEEEIRNILITRIARAVRGSKNGADVDVRCFGSFASGLYLPTADMDLVAVSEDYLRGGRPCYNTKNNMYALKRHLEGTGMALPDTVIVIHKAKVPIVKFVDYMTGIKVDISFENMTGVTAVGTLLQWKQQFPAMPVLVVLIKQFLAMRGLNEVFGGGLGGFAIICLVTSMLQLEEDIQSDSKPTEVHYGELLMRFFDMYGSFNIETTAITMNPPGYYDKREHYQAKQNPKRLTIIDPNNPRNDISGGTSQIETVLHLFKQAHTAVQTRLNQHESGQDVEASILECILGGDYTSFMHQRQRLSRLHRGHSVTPPPPPSAPLTTQIQPQKRPKPPKPPKPEKRQKLKMGQPPRKPQGDVHAAARYPDSSYAPSRPPSSDSGSMRGNHARNGYDKSGYIPNNSHSSNGYVYDPSHRHRSYGNYRYEDKRY